MEDSAIIDLYFARSEEAIKETAAKYGKMLKSVSFREPELPGFIAFTMGIRKMSGFAFSKASSCHMHHAVLP